MPRLHYLISQAWPCHASPRSGHSGGPVLNLHGEVIGWAVKSFRHDLGPNGQLRAVEMLQDAVGQVLDGLVPLRPATADVRDRLLGHANQRLRMGEAELQELVAAAQAAKAGAQAAEVGAQAAEAGAQVAEAGAQTAKADAQAAEAGAQAAAKGASGHEQAASGHSQDANLSAGLAAQSASSAASGAAVACTIAVLEAQQEQMQAQVKLQHASQRVSFLQSTLLVSQPTLLQRVALS